MIDNYFAVYRGRRRALISGKAPPGLNGVRPPQARAWQAYQHRMSQEPPWERAERYRLMISHQGFRSIRALAKTIGEDHSRIARILQVLELPQSALETLRRNSDNARLLAHFTEKRLRQLVRQDRDETAILREIEQVIQGNAKHFRHPASLPAVGMREARPIAQLADATDQKAQFQEVIGQVDFSWMP